MAERTIKAHFFTYGGRAAFRGQTVDLSDEDIARGERLGAFEDGGPGPKDNVQLTNQGEPDGGASVGENAPEDAEPPGDPDGKAVGDEDDKPVVEPEPGDPVAAVRAAEARGDEPPRHPDFAKPSLHLGGDEPVEPNTTNSMVQSQEIDNLKGKDLDQAVKDAGIDAKKGGTLKDGSLSSDEKRAALKSARGIG